MLMRLSPQSRASPHFNHSPLVQCWRGHEPSLIRHMLALLTEWRRRGLPDDMEDPIGPGLKHWLLPEEWGTLPPVPPPWLGWEHYHASTRAWLLYKDAEWYEQFCWEEGPRRTILWPQRKPRPGDTLVGQDHTILTVLEVQGPACRCIRDSDRKRTSVSVADVQRRRWTYASREED